MTFKEAMEHYRAGTATDAERQLIEEEIEKNQLIAEYLDEQWEEAPVSENLPVQEMQQVRKSLRKRNILIVLTSLILSAVLLLTIIYVAIPALEKTYRDPEQNSYGCVYGVNDLELNLAAYSELFVPGQDIVSIGSRRVGFAAYDLTVQYWDSARGGASHYSYATLSKNELSLEKDRLLTVPVNVFANACYPTYYYDTRMNLAVREKLSALPDYVQVYAAISFTEDMSMEELISFQEGLEEGHIVWAGIRNCPEDEQRFPLCGMAPFSGGVVREGINDDYPLFEIKGEEDTAANLETHFKSLLQFSADRVKDGTAIGSTNGDTYYSDVLSYVEENGIYSYGCYIVTSPQTLLDLLDNDVISQTDLQDAWIDF